MIREPTAGRDDKFLSTLSLRRATKPKALKSRLCVISIHALLAESDATSAIIAAVMANFYPRSPCGERRIRKTRFCQLHDFYPRSPCGERPASSILMVAPSNFYPRSPCGERLSPPLWYYPPLHFYPRSPCGERPPRLWPSSISSYFYPRSPCGERRYSCPRRCAG